MCVASYPGIEFAVSQGGSVLSSWAASSVLTGAAAQTPIEQNIHRLNYCRQSEKKLHTASGYNRTFCKSSLTCHINIELLVNAFIPTAPSILDAKQSFLHVHFVPRLLHCVRNGSLYDLYEQEEWLQQTGNEGMSVPGQRWTRHVVAYGRQWCLNH